MKKPKIIKICKYNLVFDQSVSNIQHLLERRIFSYSLQYITVIWKPYPVTQLQILSYTKHRRPKNGEKEDQGKTEQTNNLAT